MLLFPKDSTSNRSDPRRIGQIVSPSHRTDEIPHHIKHQTTDPIIWDRSGPCYIAHIRSPSYQIYQIPVLYIGQIPHHIGQIRSASYRTDQIPITSDKIRSPSYRIGQISIRSEHIRSPIISNTRSDPHHMGQIRSPILSDGSDLHHIGQIRSSSYRTDQIPIISDIYQIPMLSDRSDYHIGQMRPP